MDLSTNYAPEFESNWIALAQQTKARLEPYVKVTPINGDRKRFSRIAAVADAERLTRNGDTVIGNTATDQRWAIWATYNPPAELIDPSEKSNLGNLVLPNSALVAAHAAAYNRRKDAVAIATALNPVTIGELGNSTAVLPASQQIAAGGTGLTLAKLIKARELLDNADIDEYVNNARVLVVTTQQISDLMAEAKATSSDYVGDIFSLQSGKLDMFMGFKFVLSKQIPKASTTRTCPFWIEGAIQLVEGPHLSKISERADKNHSIQIWSQWAFGGTRVADEAVGSIDCIEA